MNKESKKLSWAIGLVAGLGVLSIAYAALSSTLYINGSGEVKAGAVEFTACAPTKIGTNDVTANTADISGGALVGNYSAAQSGYAYNAAEASAFGKAATTFSLQRDGGYIDTEGAAQMQIWRGSKTSNHYADSLTITGTELYDYGSYVIYDVTLHNYAQNDMKLTVPPVIKAYFTPTGGSTKEDADSNVKVTVHATEAAAVANNGATLSAFAGEAGAANAFNYLRTNGETHWYIKVFRRVGSEVGAGAGQATGLRNGTFTFTTNITDEANGPGGGIGVWETAGVATTA